MPLTPGTTLGPYEILSPIGAGGMGDVYKARDTRLDRTVKTSEQAMPLEVGDLGLNHADLGLNDAS